MRVRLLGGARDYVGVGYIAGSGDGIVTVGGVPSRRELILFDVSNYHVVERQASLENGHYIFIGLNPNRRYLLMARDLEPSGEEPRYEPFCWDYLVPATDLSVAQQRSLLQSWH